MALLIDGYNLIHAAGIVGRGRGPGGLERSRLALLNFIVESLEPAELRRTIVVFDAAGAPPNLPELIEHRGLRVRFSRGYPSADDLLEELIQADTAPRQLTVVSSDHRLHRAARRRRAQAVDADRWYEAVLRRRAARVDRAGAATTATAVAGKQESRPASPEVEYWLRQFVVEDEPTEAVSGGLLDRPRPAPQRGPAPPASKKPPLPPSASPAAADEPRRRATRRIRGTRGPERRDRRELDSGPIFPPDYGADLAE